MKGDILDWYAKWDVWNDKKLYLLKHQPHFSFLLFFCVCEFNICANKRKSHPLFRSISIGTSACMNLYMIFIFLFLYQAIFFFFWVNFLPFLAVFRIVLSILLLLLLSKYLPYWKYFYLNDVNKNKDKVRWCRIIAELCMKSTEW